MMIQFFGWQMVAFFTIIALAYLCGTVSVVREAGRYPSKKFTREYPCAGTMVLLLAAFSKVGTAPQTYICLCAFILTAVCVIIQEKAKCHLSWWMLMNEILDTIADFFQITRRFLLWIEAIRLKISVRMRAGIALAAITVLTVLAVLGVVLHMDVFLTVLLCAAVICILVIASKALHSCRWILFCWLALGVLITCVVVTALPYPENGAVAEVAKYIAATILFSALWIILAGAADETTVVMGCGIINTCTTILLIVINVLSVWGSKNFPQSGVFTTFWDELQYYSTVILLPLVAAGYLSALLKQFQVYWKEKHPPKDVEQADEPCEEKPDL